MVDSKGVAYKWEHSKHLLEVNHIRNFTCLELVVVWDPAKETLGSVKHLLTWWLLVDLAGYVNLDNESDHFQDIYHQAQLKHHFRTIEPLHNLWLAAVVQ